MSLQTWQETIVGGSVDGPIALLTAEGAETFLGRVAEDALIPSFSGSGVEQFSGTLAFSAPAAVFTGSEQATIIGSAQVDTFVASIAGAASEIAVTVVAPYESPYLVIGRGHPGLSVRPKQGPNDSSNGSGAEQEAEELYLVGAL